MTAAAGYSGTPLANKLGLKPGMTVWIDGMPENIWRSVEQPGVTRLERPAAGLEWAHIFVTSYEDMVAKLASLRSLIDPGGQVWVSWPKKASKRPTDITEDRIRDAILPSTDWVDVKICAVDDVWSGLKLMIRRSAR